MFLKCSPRPALTPGFWPTPTFVETMQMRIFHLKKDVGFICQIPNVADILYLLAELLTCSDTGTYQIKQISILEN